MDLESFIVAVFCLIDELLPRAQHSQRLRQRGPRPRLADSEVLTMLVVGEYLGLDQDQAIYRSFRRHYAAWFPAIATVHRTTFTRQAANLWVAMEWLRDELLAEQLSDDPGFGYVDSVCVPVCRLARAYRCRRFRGEAAYGFDAMSKQVFYGFGAHLRGCWPGVIVGASLAPGNVHELHVLEADLRPGPPGLLLADRRYWSPTLREDLAQDGLRLVARPPTGLRAAPVWTAEHTQARRQIETVASQFVERFGLRRIWARDTWHLTARWGRKLLSHTLCILLCQQQGLPPLRFAELVTA